ncbi:MAG: hybrid sensor histidine kinase/response regulator [Candidatus Hodarchaeales archaeon]
MKEKLAVILIRPFFTINEESELDYQKARLSASVILVLIIIEVLRLSIEYPLKEGLSLSLFFNEGFFLNLIITLILIIVYILNRTKYYEVGFIIVALLSFFYFLAVMNPRISPYPNIYMRSAVVISTLLVTLILMNLFLSIKWLFVIGLFESTCLIIYFFVESLTGLYLMTISIYILITLFSVTVISYYRNKQQKVLKQMNKELRISELQARAASKAKSDFLAKMSHDIRTPLHVLTGAAHILEEPSSEEEKIHYLQVLRRETSTLLGLVTDVLDLAKIETGRFDIRQMEFDLKKLVENVFISYKPLAEEKDLEMRLTIHSSDFPSLFIGDPDRIGQILRNIVHNAIKFTSKGYVDVQVNLYESKENIELKITDTGKGMTEQELDRFIQPYEQGSYSEGEGYGLGLSIVKQLVNKMEGDIKVESVIDQGTEFIITLSLPFVDHPREIAKVVYSNDDFPVKNILVADDNKENRELLGIFLKKEKFIVDFAENGLEAVKKREKYSYNLILMDMRMDVMDGFTATKIIREWEKDNAKQNVPIVALTALAFKSDMERCYAVGCNSYLSKPFKKEDLLIIVKKYAS